MRMPHNKRIPKRDNVMSNINTPQRASGLGNNNVVGGMHDGVFGIVPNTGNTGITGTANHGPTMLRFGAVTQDWVSRVNTAGGSVSTSTMAAVNKWLMDLNAAGLYSKILRANLFCGNNLTACITPLINVQGGASDTNVNLIESDYSEALGLHGDGSTKYLKTGLSPTGPTIGIACYSRTAFNTSTRFFLACRDGGVTDAYRLGRTSATNMGTNLGGNANFASVAEDPTPAAFYVGSRVSSTDLQIYRNGVSLSTNATATVAGNPNQELYVFCQNSAGSPSGFLIGTIYLAGYAIDDGTMTTAQQATYYTIWQAFQTALGRQV